MPIIITQRLTHTDYLWLIGKTYPGRPPKPLGFLDGRTITVVDVRQTDVFDGSVCVELLDDTGRRWCTSSVEAIAHKLKGEDNG